MNVAKPAEKTPPAPEKNIPIDHTQHIPIWKGKFHKRRMAYKQMYYNRAKAKILKDHIDSDQPYILKKHRPKFAYSGEDYIDRLEVSKALQIQESKSLNNSSKKHQDTITAIDREIEDCISKTPGNPQQKEELRKLWKKEVSVATTTSERMVSDNIRYMKELPKTAPFTGFVELRQMSNGSFKAPRSAQDQDYRRDDQYTGDNGHQVNHDQRQRRYQQRNGYNNKRDYSYRGKSTTHHDPRQNNSDSDHAWREPGVRVFRNSGNKPAAANPFR